MITWQSSRLLNELWNVMNNGQKKIKVAFVLGALNRGGTESLILDICRNNDTAPFDMVCVYRKEGNLSEEFHKTKVKMLCLPCGNKLSYIWQLRHLLQNEQIDIVHSQTPSNTAVLGIALLGTKIKLITSFHGHSFAHANYFIRKWVYFISRKIICVSKNQKQYYENHWCLPGVNKLEVVHNGIDTGKIVGIDYVMPDFLIKKDKNEITFAVVGSFGSGRSQEFLLRVIKENKLIFSEKKLKVYFIGGVFKGEEHLYMNCEQYIFQHQIDNIAIMLGVRKDVLAILQNVDGFLYATKTDTFGIAVVEAMLSGVPVIVNDFVVMKEISQDGELATLYKSNDIDDCADKILAFVDNMGQYKQRAKSQIHRISELYSIDNHINNLLNIYEKL